jgi:hypothetical protein
MNETSHLSSMQTPRPLFCEPVSPLSVLSSVPIVQYWHLSVKKSQHHCGFFPPLVVLAALTVCMYGRPVLASLILAVCDWEDIACA